MCTLCNGVSWRPKVAMCCQKVFCGPCLDGWLKGSTVCPNAQCRANVVVRDGSTGGCAEQRVKKLDRSSTGVQAVLWRVYSNLRVRCVHFCGWSGDIFSYDGHLAECPVEKRQLTAQPQVRSAQQAQSATPPVSKSPESSDSSGPIYTIVWAHHAGDDSQLSLSSSDRVSVKQRAAHGWVYGRLVSSNQPGREGREGWFPSFCLPEERPPPPQQSPPPMSPPTGSTRVTREYEASDPAQLSLREGELVYVRQRDRSGWTFVVKVSAQEAGKREGWIPDWLLEHGRFIAEV